jgi:hypothetical protein
VTTLLLLASLQQNHRKKLWQLLSPFFAIKPLKKVMETTVIFFLLKNTAIVFVYAIVFIYVYRLHFCHYNTTIKKATTTIVITLFSFTTPPQKKVVTTVVIAFFFSITPP